MNQAVLFYVFLDVSIALKTAHVLSLVGTAGEHLKTTKQYIRGIHCPNASGGQNWFLYHGSMFWNCCYEGTSPVVDDYAHLSIVLNLATYGDTV